MIYDTATKDVDVLDKQHVHVDVYDLHEQATQQT
jgi:hypothetical protein